MSRKIEVVEYRPEWAKLFKSEAKEIKKILGRNCVAVHHIGSTAVKGLKAKPVIDMMPVVKDISLVDAHNEEFEALGYECKGEFGITGRRFYVKGGDDRTHHVHIFEERNTHDVERHLAVRDYLNSHPDAAAAYGKLKSELAEKFSCDNEGYCAGKDAFVKQLEKDALEWKKKQSDIGTHMSIGMCLGMSIGCGIGLLFSNISIGMCLGISIGMLVGMLIAIQKYKNPDENENEGI